MLADRFFWGFLNFLVVFFFFFSPFLRRYEYNTEGNFLLGKFSLAGETTTQQKISEKLKKCKPCIRQFGYSRSSYSSQLHFKPYPTAGVKSFLGRMRKFSLIYELFKTPLFSP